MGSTRLPGKVLMSLGRQRVLPLILSRLRRARSTGSSSRTSTLPQDDPVAAAARDAGACASGDPSRTCWHDTEQRSLGFPADEVVRVTADNPFVDPDTSRRGQ